MTSLEFWLGYTSLNFHPDTRQTTLALQSCVAGSDLLGGFHAVWCKNGVIKKGVAPILKASHQVH